MSTIVYEKSTGAVVASANAAYVTARDNASGTVFIGSQIQVGGDVTAVWTIYRAIMPFDTSAVPVGIASALLWFNVIAKSGTSPDLIIQDRTTSNEPPITTDYAKATFFGASFGSVAAASVAVGWNYITISDLTIINSVGTTYLGLRERTYDKNEGGIPPADRYVTVAFATSSTPPYLELYYGSGGGGTGPIYGRSCRRRGRR